MTTPVTKRIKTSITRLWFDSETRAIYEINAFAFAAAAVAGRFRSVPFRSIPFWCLFPGGIHLDEIAGIRLQLDPDNNKTDGTALLPLLPSLLPPMQVFA